MGVSLHVAVQFEHAEARVLLADAIKDNGYARGVDRVDDGNELSSTVSNLVRMGIVLAPSSTNCAC